MAEGHAVVRWKRRLAPLVGEPLRGIKMPKRWGERPQSLVGEHVTGVETHGKHLLLNLSTGETLHCHGAQYGSWQVGERPLGLRKEEKHVRLRLATDAHEAVFFHGPTVELLTPEERAGHERLNSLGPDVMAGTPARSAFDRDEAARRVWAEGDRPISPTVLDQRVMAGVGNIYKSEGLFLAGIDPRRPAASVSREELDRFWDAVIPIMWEGTESWGRTKTTPPELRERGHTRWVYQRKGKPCLVCDTPVELVRLPPYDRATYLCPRCQS
jgi:DNA-formamidopyrimidine glycosylase